MRSLQPLAERVARARCASILARIAAAIGEHAPDAQVTMQGERLVARGRGLGRRWIAEPGLRFARRIMP